MLLRNACDAQIPRLRSTSWHVECRSVLEDAACFVVDEHRECISSLVLQDRLNPTRKRRSPIFSMLVDHGLIPSFFEPCPIVLLARGEACLQARKAIEYLQAPGFRFCAACVGAALPKRVHGKGFNSVGGCSSAFERLYCRSAFLKLRDCGIAILDCQRRSLLSLCLVF